MWVYEKKLEYPVKIKNTNPKLAKIIIAQYGGAGVIRLYLKRGSPAKQQNCITLLEVSRDNSYKQLSFRILLHMSSTVVNQSPLI